MKRKLIYVSDAYLPEFKANAVHVMKMCNAFSKVFDKVTLYCHSISDEDNLRRRYGVANTFSIKCHFQNLNIGNNMKMLISCMRNAFDINKNFNGELIYGRSLFTLFFVKKSIPFMYESHAMRSTKLLRIIEKVVLNRDSLQKLIVISKPLRDAYLDFIPKLKEENIVVLHDGADTVDNTMLPKVVLQEDHDKQNIKIGYVGSLYPGKCMEVLLPIAKELPNMLFHIVGGDDYWVEYWKKEAQNKRIYNLVFYGKVDPAKVYSYYDAFDILLMPYSQRIFIDKDQKYDIGQWISPLKIFEAMAMKKPMIVSALPSIKEVLENGFDSCIVESNSPSQWIEAIKFLASNPLLRVKIGLNAYQKFVRKYSWQRRAEIIYKLQD